MADDKQPALIAAYQELSQSFRVAQDNRMKLASIVPVVMGIGITLLLNSSFSSSWFVTPLGLLGAVVTLTLLFYDLRQLHLACEFARLGVRIEGELGVEGHFTRRYPLLVTRVGINPIIYTIYAALIGAWVFVAFYNIANFVLILFCSFVIWVLVLSISLYSVQESRRTLGFHTSDSEKNI
jgi:hypothetical protein